MLNEWTDDLPARDAARLWRERAEQEEARRLAVVEDELRETSRREGAAPAGFYEAMQHFLTLRDKLFPDLPPDPAWRILVTLAQTTRDDARASTTGIAYGAGVPPTTALRCIAAMEVQGIVERVPNIDDKRQVMIRLTAEGRRRLDVIAERWVIRVTLIAVMLTALAFYATRAIAG